MHADAPRERASPPGMSAPALGAPGPPAAARRERRLLLVVLALAWTSAVAAWLAAALGHPLAPAASRSLVVLAGVSTLAVVGRSLWRTATGRTTLPAATGRWLIGVLLVAAVVSLVGLEHEVTGRSYGDEGIYRANAERINEGRLLRPNFIYPHLLYYLDAVALWIAGLFPHAAARWAGLWGVAGPLAVASLATRMVTALLAAATVWPVFSIGISGEAMSAVAADLSAASLPLAK